MNKKTKSLVFLCIAMAIIVAYSFFLTPVSAKETGVSSERKLQDLVIKNQYAVLMLYQEDSQTRKDKMKREQIRQLREMFEAVSSDTVYKEADLAFLSANVAKKGVAFLPDRYKIQLQELPAFVIYKNSKPAKGANGQPLVLTGFVDRGKLQDFINQNLEAELQDVLEEKAEARKAELEEARIRSYYAPRVYFGLGFGGGYPPYWGWGYRRRWGGWYW
jgi:hypothetical protein